MKIKNEIKKEEIEIEKSKIIAGSSAAIILVFLVLSAIAFFIYLYFFRVCTGFGGCGGF